MENDPVDDAILYVDAAAAALWSHGAPERLVDSLELMRDLLVERGPNVGMYVERIRVFAADMLSKHGIELDTGAAIATAHHRIVRMFDDDPAAIEDCK